MSISDWRAAFFLRFMRYKRFWRDCGEAETLCESSILNVECALQQRKNKCRFFSASFRIAESVFEEMK
ncbi:MAG: hypothetical protein DBX55_00065 [Verrucomicrobia bacterium]|nr:MAG: hypothetical protein DBX55_00065 [Verrucomicrobiota bacterium]